MAELTESTLRSLILNIGDPPACGHCGAMAGACDDYPKCPQGASCLCCGLVGKPKVWVTDQPKHYVCETCKDASYRFSEAEKHVRLALLSLEYISDEGHDNADVSDDADGIACVPNRDMRYAQWADEAIRELRRIVPKETK